MPNYYRESEWEFCYELAVKCWYGLMLTPFVGGLLFALIMICAPPLAISVGLNTGLLSPNNYLLQTHPDQAAPGVAGFGIGVAIFGPICIFLLNLFGLLVLVLTVLIRAYRKMLGFSKD